jgi:glycosyltransferase involved in cell wall biosynthesis
VLSWSVIEAMSAGCYVIASDTPPVRDAIVDGVNGKLLPFFNHNLLADALIEACEAPPDAFDRLRAAARETAVTRFSRADGRAKWLQLIDEVRARQP